MKDLSQGQQRGCGHLEGPHGPAQGVRLKLLSRSLGRETSRSCRDKEGAGTDCVVPPDWAQRLHMPIRNPMTLINVLKCCKMGLLIPSELVLKLNMIVFCSGP